MDGMRYLGADPAHPADHIERSVMRGLLRRVDHELKRIEKRAG
jgi:hypothetical protein